MRYLDKNYSNTSAISANRLKVFLNNSVPSLWRAFLQRLLSHLAQLEERLHSTEGQLKPFLDGP
jgi:hypothetical protein